MSATKGLATIAVLVPDTGSGFAYAPNRLVPWHLRPHGHGGRYAKVVMVRSVM